MPLSARPGASLRPVSVSEIYDRAGIGGRPMNIDQWNEENNRLLKLHPLALPPVGAPVLGDGGGMTSFGGIGQQAPIDAHTYGDTFAPVSHGAGEYHGLSTFDSQFSGAKPQMTSWGEEWGAASKPAPPKRINPETGVAMLADGTDGQPIPHGVPFIAGDPQKSKKPNPELIIPTPQGIHVIPMNGTDGRGTKGTGLKPPPHGLDEFYKLNPNTPTAAASEVVKLMMNPQLKMPIRIPKLAYGTESGHVNWSDEYIPGFVPQLDTGGAFGGVQPLPDGQGLEARDADGNVVGFSKGLPPAPVMVPHGTTATASPPASAPIMNAPGETEDQYNRRLAMNPQQIDVGFTPRPQLHGFADADALRASSAGQSRDERGIERLQRTVMREAQRDPRLGAAVLSGKAQAQADAIRAEFERKKHDDLVAHQAADLRRKSLAAAGYADTGAGPGQPYAPTVAAQRLQGDTARNAVVDAREAERLGISREQLAIQKQADQRASEKVQRELNPQSSVLPIQGTNLGTAMINGRQADRVPPLEQTAPGTAPFMVGRMPMPGSPPQFQPFNPKAQVESAKAEAATAKLEAQTLSDHLTKAEKLGAILGNEKVKIDDATRRRYETLMQHHLSEYEKALGMDAAPVGMGDLKAAEAAPASPQDSIAALIQRTNK